MTRKRARIKWYTFFNLCSLSGDVRSIGIFLKINLVRFFASARLSHPDAPGIWRFLCSVDSHMERKLLLAAECLTGRNMHHIRIYLCTYIVSTYTCCKYVVNTYRKLIDISYFVNKKNSDRFVGGVWKKGRFGRSQECDLKSDLGRVLFGYWGCSDSSSSSSRQTCHGMTTTTKAMVAVEPLARSHAYVRTYTWRVLAAACLVVFYLVRFWRGLFELLALNRLFRQTDRQTYVDTEGIE